MTKKVIGAGAQNAGAAVMLYSLSREMVAVNVAAAVSLFETLFATTPSDGRTFVQCGQVAIPINRDEYPDHADCGLTKAALLAALRDKPWRDRVSVVEYQHGDPFGTMPNCTMFNLARLGHCDWGIRISIDAGQYWSSDLCERLNHAASEGATVMFLDIPGQPELSALGIGSNHLAVYNLRRLDEVGGNFPINHHLIRAQAPESFTTPDGRHYGAVGGEEGVTTILMAKNRSNKIAFLKGDAVPPRFTPRGGRRAILHQAMMETKAERTLEAIRLARLDVRAIERALMGTF